MTSYYAACINEQGLIETSALPCKTYTQAIGAHTNAIQLESLPLAPGRIYPTRHVLLDMGTVEMQDRREMDEMLHHDPVLRAVFEYGRNIGRDEEYARRSGRVR